MEVYGGVRRCMEVYEVYDMRRGMGVWEKVRGRGEGGKWYL